MRIKLKSSKSYPNELLQQQSEQKQQQHQQNEQKPQTILKTPNTVQSKNKLTVQNKHEEGDNSSSGVSSDQEMQITQIVKTSSSSSASTISSSIATSMTSTNQPVTQKSIGFVTQMKNNLDNGKTTECDSVLSTIQPMKSSPQSIKIIDALNKKSMKLPPLSNVTKKISSIISVNSQSYDDGNDRKKTTITMLNDEHEYYDDDNQMDSPSPPSKGFQRHNSLTRKQAAQIAMNRAINARPAVSLVQLPPPIEGDSDNEQQQLSNMHHRVQFARISDHGNNKSSSTATTSMHQQHNHQYQQLQQQPQRRSMHSNVTVVVPPPISFDKNVCDTSPSAENIVLAPPPQFCDCTNANITKIMNNNNAAGMIAENNGMVTASSTTNDSHNQARSVRIVGAVPKISRLQSH